MSTSSAVIAAPGGQSAGNAPARLDAPQPIDAREGGPGPGRRHFGLRARVTAAFAIGAAVLSGALATSTYALVHHYLLNDQEARATTTTYADARAMRELLAYPGTNVGEALSSLTEPDLTEAQATVALLHRHGEWYSSSVSVNEPTGSAKPEGLPTALVTLVNTGVPARQRIIWQGQPAVAIGVPVTADGASYFEIHSLSDLERTLDLLAVVLLTCSVATTVGGLLVGRWASGRLVRPLRRTADVAAAIAGGAMEQRLPPTNDPDLAVLAKSFNEMVGALADRIKRDAQFASDVSHELRSPLTTVQATIALLEASGPSLPPDGRRALALLSSEIERFSVMVQDLLEMSRFDAGAADLDMEELELDVMVTNTVAAYTGGGVPVVVAPDGVGAWVWGDQRRLQRVLVNLLDNAQAHGGGAVAVRVDRRGYEAYVVVEDAGPGVRIEERESIFERFYRGAAAGRRGGSSGTGLGLALVAEHVKAHQGDVEVTDRVGGGACFVVRLPIMPIGPPRDM
jgi:two-component system sensor histidine kinase MtrB